MATGLAVASTLGDRLRERIRAEGPLPFAAWMDACLYDPDGGFYMQPERPHPAGTGPEHGFATSPTLHPFFARAVGADALLQAVRQRFGHAARPVSVP